MEESLKGEILRCCKLTRIGIQSAHAEQTPVTLVTCGRALRHRLQLLTGPTGGTAGVLMATFGLSSSRLGFDRDL